MKGVLSQRQKFDYISSYAAEIGSSKVGVKSLVIVKAPRKELVPFSWSTRRDGAASGLLVSDCWWVPKSVLWGYRRTLSDASGFWGVLHIWSLRLYWKLPNHAYPSSLLSPLRYSRPRSEYFFISAYGSPNPIPRLASSVRRTREDCLPCIPLPLIMPRPVTK